MDKEYKKILVAGGEGFLGKNIVKKLEERNLNFVSLDLNNGHDFRDFEKTKKLFEEEKFDAVIHCAAFVGGIQFGYEHPAELFYNNILMTTYLMETARLSGVKRFVNPISNCVYPGEASLFKEEELWSGPMHESVASYGFAKKAGLVQGISYNKQYGFDSVHLILPNMYGPGDHFEAVKSHALGALIMKFVEAKRKNIPEVTVWGTGKPIREWLYIEDGAEALIKALFIESNNDPINIGIGKGISIAELASLIKDAVGYEGNIVFDSSKPDGAPTKTMEVSKMKEIFNWTPETQLIDGIKKTVEYYNNNF
jgi:GDP-L-fucose synthase